MKLSVQESNKEIYISVDCVIFGLSETGLQVLLIKLGYEPAIGQWALPGGLIEKNETLEGATERLLTVLTGVNDVYTEQFHTFSDLTRYPDLRIVTVGVYAIVRPEVYALEPSWYASEVAWVPIAEVKEVAYDHINIFKKGLETLQRDIRTKPIGFNLLPEQFTLGQFQHLFESVLQIKLDRRNFRRKVEALNVLTLLPEKQIGAHAPANLYEFNQEGVETAQKDGYLFKVA